MQICPNKTEADSSGAKPKATQRLKKQKIKEKYIQTAKRSEKPGQIARPAMKCSAVLRLALRSHIHDLQGKTAEQLPSKEGSAYPFDLCNQKTGGNFSRPLKGPLIPDCIF
jgi:hypothetical protein